MRWDERWGLTAIAACLAMGALVSWTPGPNVLDAAVQQLAANHDGLADEAAWAGWLLPYVAQTALLLAFALLFIAGDWRTPLAVLGTFAVADLLSTGLKHLFGRIRPETASLGSFAYPSSHAAGAAMQMGFLFLVVLPALSGDERPRRWWVAAWLVSSAVGALARVLEGEHWLTDVVGGFLLGAKPCWPADWAVPSPGRPNLAPPSPAPPRSRLWCDARGTLHIPWRG